MATDEKAAELIRRHHDAAHAMQSGVAMEMNMPTRAAATTPKHLRTGINAAMADAEGLVRLLIAKGIFTEEEYLEAIAVSMEKEKARYEERLTEALGKRVTLA